MRIGLIGCGGVARLCHLPAIRSVAGLELHAICDVNEENLQIAGTEFDVPHAFTGIEAFMDSGIGTSWMPRDTACRCCARSRWR